MNIGDQVNVTIKSIDEMGILITMDDYDQEGFIPLSEDKKVKGIKKPKRKVGDQCVATIIRMERGFVDLSL